MSELDPEQLFNASKLSLATPEHALELPADLPGPYEWLQQLSTTADRKLAFFDEVLSAFLILRVPCSAPDEDGRPINELIQFLTLVQVGFEASYISPTPEPPANLSAGSAPGRLLGPPPPGRPSASGTTPKTASPLKPRPPPLLPPQTPNPTPQTDDSEKKYAVAEGIQLHSFIWGDAPTKDVRNDKFSLIWDQSSKEWVAIYRLDVTIVYIKTRVPDPLLCITTSLTLRDKPLLVTIARQPIFDLLPAESRAPTPTQLNMKPLPSSPGLGDEFNDLEEINLLDGLANSISFPRPDTSAGLQVPTSRLSPSLRRQAYWLPPQRPGSVMSMPTPTSARTARPTLRKAFRKTLSTVNGFHVRMRTIFVPYVFIPGQGDDDDERREAGSEERSVVLCVEVENTGESSKDFEIESILVKVSGEGASSRLISWGEKFGKTNPEAVFPLRLHPIEQYNLLYSVTFLHPIESVDPLLPRTVDGAQHAQISADLQRSVSIIIKGRPCELINGVVSYPTEAFNSRWNCQLNLSPNQQPDLGEYQLNEPLGSGDALPAPATPFPVPSPRAQSDFEINHPISSARSPAIGGSKRHTLAGLSSRRSTVPSPIKVRFSLPATSSNGSSQITANLPSIAINSEPSPLSPMVSSAASTPTTSGFFPPQTPAYPAWSPDAISAPPTPYQQAYMTGSVGSSIGQLIEPHRDRRMTQAGAMLPSTPGPSMFGSSIPERLATMEPYSEPVIVSVALLNPSQATGTGYYKPSRHIKNDWIYPLDIFALEIFVFNQSPITRRFEVSLPDRKIQKKLRQEEKRRSAGHDGTTGSRRLVGEALSRIGSQAGIIPLENRVRIGPLRPDNCQSVRMQFMALRPGLHSIDILTITDTEAEFSLNLRSVMDVVVHEPTPS